MTAFVISACLVVSDMFISDRYVVKTILTQHHEKITVTSENGVTAFTFTMQMAR